MIQKQIDLIIVQSNTILQMIDNHEKRILSIENKINVLSDKSLSIMNGMIDKIEELECRIKELEPK